MYKSLSMVNRPLFIIPQSPFPVPLIPYHSSTLQPGQFAKCNMPSQLYTLWIWVCMHPFNLEHIYLSLQSTLLACHLTHPALFMTGPQNNLREALLYTCRFSHLLLLTPSPTLNTLVTILFVIHRLQLHFFVPSPAIQSENELCLSSTSFPQI